MSWSRTLLWVIALIVSLAPILPNPSLANSGLTFPSPSDTESSFLRNFIGFLPLPSRLFLTPISLVSSPPFQALAPGSQSEWPASNWSPISATQGYIAKDSMAYGNPYVRIQLPNSTSKFLAMLLVRYDAHPKPILLIEYPMPVEAALKDSGSSPVAKPILSVGQRIEVLALVSTYVHSTDAEDTHTSIDSANAYVHRAFRRAALGDTSSRIGLLDLAPALLEALAAQARATALPVEQPRVTRKAPPPIRPGAQVYRPRMLQRGELTEWRRQRRAEEVQALTEADTRRQLAVQQALESPSKPSGRR